MNFLIIKVVGTISLLQYKNWKLSEIIYPIMHDKMCCIPGNTRVLDCSLRRSRPSCIVNLNRLMTFEQRYITVALFTYLLDLPKSAFSKMRQT